MSITAADEPGSIQATLMAGIPGSALVQVIGHEIHGPLQLTLTGQCQPVTGKTDAPVPACNRLSVKPVSVGSERLPCDSLSGPHAMGNRTGEDSHNDHALWPRLQDDLTSRQEASRGTGLLG